jgi:hypothetical protein
MGKDYTVKIAVIFPGIAIAEPRGQAVNREIGSPSRFTA